MISGIHDVCDVLAMLDPQKQISERTQLAYAHRHTSEAFDATVFDRQLSR